eukprot:957227_1
MKYDKYSQLFKYLLQYNPFTDLLSLDIKLDDDIDRNKPIMCNVYKLWYVKNFMQYKQENLLVFMKMLSAKQFPVDKLPILGDMMKQDNSLIFNKDKNGLMLITHLAQYGNRDFLKQLIKHGVLDVLLFKDTGQDVLSEMIACLSKDVVIVIECFAAFQNKHLSRLIPLIKVYNIYDAYNAILHQRDPHQKISIRGVDVRLALSEAGRKANPQIFLNTINCKGWVSNFEKYKEDNEKAIHWMLLDKTFPISTLTDDFLGDFSLPQHWELLSNGDFHNCQTGQITQTRPDFVFSFNRGDGLQILNRFMVQRRLLIGGGVATCIFGREVTDQLCTQYDIYIKWHTQSIFTNGIRNRYCFYLGFIASQIQNWNAHVGVNKEYSTGWVVDSGRNVFGRVTGNDKNVVDFPRYPKYKAALKFGKYDTFRLSFNFNDDTVWLYHNEHQAEWMTLKRRKGITVEFALWYENEGIEVTKYKFS